ncbi:34551_t:CDS:2 [Gigaspora margarita]|uniref:34551_t:CDS:1 n=1 Tax=Gigaspora margarita TaxID=4874 RepID=A0ABN7V7G7_GIGMA|nr:34551_t:CDS:2 [Gigaspora margarita]
MHSGIALNETADLLAKEALSLEERTIIATDNIKGYTFIPLTCCKCMTNEETSDHLATCPADKETWKQIEKEIAEKIWNSIPSDSQRKRNSKTRYEEKIRKPGSWKQSNQPHTTVLVRRVDNELPEQNLERKMRANYNMEKENRITTKTKRKKRERKHFESQERPLEMKIQ